MKWRQRIIIPALIIVSLIVLSDVRSSDAALLLQQQQQQQQHQPMQYEAAGRCPTGIMGRRRGLVRRDSTGTRRLESGSATILLHLSSSSRIEERDEHNVNGTSEWGTPSSSVTSRSLMSTTTVATATTATTTTTTMNDSSSSHNNNNNNNNNNQALYGVSMSYPSTFVRCGKCQTCYAIALEDLATGSSDHPRGRRLSCSVCDHTWFQSKDKLLELRDGYEMQVLPSEELHRIALNIQQGKKPSFVGDMKLYVGNIDFDSTEQDLYRLFRQVGDVGDVSLIRDDNTGRIRGFGFVTMRTKEDGHRAIQELNGIEMNGRNIAIRESTN
jgi:DNA-directed RNA polymerase subunit M/transcription elongation factor TFIIS